MSRQQYEDTATVHLLTVQHIRCSMFSSRAFSSASPTVEFAA